VLSMMDDYSSVSRATGSAELNSAVIIRPWTCTDCEEIVRLIKELSSFENLEEQMNITADELRRDGFGGSPIFRCMVVEKKQSETSDASTVTSGDTSNETNTCGSLVGYTLFYYKYSTWEGRCIYLEDIYIAPDYRKKGIGHALIKAVAKIAVEEGCKRIDFTVLSWNKSAIQFYQKLNAIDLTETEQWHFFRLNDQAIKQLAHSTS